MTDSADPDLCFTSDPDPAAVRALHDLLYAFNVEATGIDDGRLFALWLRGAAAEIVGGCFGWTWGGTCYIDTLLLPAALRGRGLGRRILELVEAEARARACHQILLQTHDFQAPGFYEKHGFAILAASDAYPRGHRHLTMRKRLL